MASDDDNNIWRRLQMTMPPGWSCHQITMTKTMTSSSNKNMMICIRLWCQMVMTSDVEDVRCWWLHMTTLHWCTQGRSVTPPLLHRHYYNSWPSTPPSMLGHLSLQRTDNPLLLRDHTRKVNRSYSWNVINKPVSGRVWPTEYTECRPCPLFDILLNKYFTAG